MNPKLGLDWITDGLDRPGEISTDAAFALHNFAGKLLLANDRLDEARSHFAKASTFLGPTTDGFRGGSAPGDIRISAYEWPGEPVAVAARPLRAAWAELNPSLAASVPTSSHSLAEMTALVQTHLQEETQNSFPSGSAIVTHVYEPIRPL